MYEEVNFENKPHYHKINSPGRPLNAKTIKFSEQPRSIVSQYIIDRKFNLKKHRTSKNDNDIHIRELTLNLTKGAQPKLTRSKSYSCEEKYGIVNSPKSVEISSLKTILNSTTLPANNMNEKQTNLFHNVVKDKFHKTETSIKRLSKRSIKSPSNEVQDVKLFVCPHSQCSYFTKISSNLSKHKRIHSSNKLYLCDQCTFSTKFSNSLNVHKRLHTNEKPFVCSHCNYKCNSSSNLKKHLRHRHPQNS